MDLARLMFPSVANYESQFDIVIPVPLGRERLKERGYNQANLLAHPIALQVNRPFTPQALFRSRETGSQVGLNAQERKQNVKNAFQGRPSLVAGKRILLVDDVATTGATLSECSTALKQAGAEHVIALTLARAVMN